MKPRQILLSAMLIVAACSQPTATRAQQGDLSAREALGLVSSQFGPQSIQWIAEMRAQGGVPQPSDWQVLAYDQRSPRLLYRFWASGGRAGDGGADDLRYPDDVPLGYFNPAQISLDSVAAFTVAEGEARRAKMAFDSCDYLLRLREYSNEPVWRLSLLDASRRLVGKLYVSASSGRVLRTIWIYRDQRARPDGMPLIIDSLAPTGDGPSLDLSQSDYTGPDNSVIGGVTSVPAVPGRVPGQVPGTMTGIHSVPLPPAPGMPVAGNPAVGNPMPSNQPQPYYAPVDPSGRVMTAPDDGIPAPPPVSSNVPGMAPSTAPIPAPPVPAPPQAPAPAPAPAPATTPKPPVTSPSGGGDSERIPPPPIPR